MPIKDRSSDRTPARVRAAADQLAITALSFLARDPERIGRFLADTGIGPGDLRSAASQSGFGAGVLAFLLSDESLLLEFTANEGFRPEDVSRAQDVLNPPFDPDAPAQREF
ncbi:MAG: hypothetical protein B7Z15_01430 [Rhizobiales bacterium 32-66-8]|jgi:hypothetical protein|nr:MAG: hypothetical protein B7Z15_01430 [Rhizobiales bacterium 32-66-8]